MSLPDWHKFGWITTHQTSATEIRDLLGVLDRDLKDSAVEDISADARLGMAYNATLKAATIALAAAGYRASRDQHHYRVLQSLCQTIGATAKEVARLDAFRKKRNMADYDRAGAASEHEVNELRAIAFDLRQRVVAWVRSKDATLLP